MVRSIDQPAITRRSARYDIEQKLDRPAPPGKPGHDVAIDNPISNDDPEWQRINRSIEAARQRRGIGQTPRQARGFGR